ncbi:anti-sigma factor antagonist [Mycolicibacterium madagascariense]|uniref:Anti-sigma factor antagonist n=1 Tax=Mycolicibacterium madagascariense TaxID=212765 RepID=A0A7I7XCI0_9MYCO|nr:STAS domain-containing protein [Mycolicibacterium madagascariense]MCV7011817.1 STAS domain-containing protein [Mycolicibacterium madagascariense]BBZ26331.1 anti-sigma factor antagonist [Mycolicibacterium madagascariense]
MTTASTNSVAKNRFRYGNPSVECHGAELHKQCRQLATVLTITGTIDAVNVGSVVAEAKGCIIAEKPFILDLSGVTSFAAQAIELLDAIDEACYAAGDEWSLIVSQPVSRTLRLCGVDEVFPATSSVPEALHHFSDVAGERRRILPILTKSA